MKTTCGPRTILWLPLLAAGWLAGCQEPPVAQQQTVKLALGSAQRAGALIYAEPGYRAAEMLQQAGGLEIARQRARLKPWRNYAVAETLLSQATALANRAAAQARDRSRRLESLARSEHAALAAELTSYRQSLDGSLLHLNAERSYAESSLKLQVAQRLLAKGEFRAARRELERGRQSLRRIGAAINERLSEEAPYLAQWRLLVDETVAESRASGGTAIVVDKSDRRTYLIKAGRVAASYVSDFGYNASRQKLFAGDGATPEGRYHVTHVKQRSKYYKALEISYPSAEDRARLERLKREGRVPRSARIGGLIEIHGEGGRREDWTMGCVALSNRDMDSILRHVGVGTPVTIVRRAENWP